MASTSFRDSMNSLGWSRRDPDFPVNTSQQTGLLSSIKSLNPFGDRGYVQLPVNEGAGAPLPASNRRDEEEGILARRLSPAIAFCLYLSFPPPPHLHPHSCPPPTVCTLITMCIFRAPPSTVAHGPATRKICSKADMRSRFFI